MQFSHFLVSISIILLAVNYLTEGGFLQKWEQIRGNIPIRMFVGLFLIHVVGLLWTTDMEYALRDIQIKLPILAIPILLGSSRVLSEKRFEWVLLFFIATSVLSSVIGAVIYFGYSNPGDDYRQMSPYMSHIRLSLMMGVAIISCFYLAKRSAQFYAIRSLFVAIGAWLLVYLFMLRAMSGIVAVLGAFAVMLWVYASKQRFRFNNLIKITVVICGLGVMGYIGYQVRSFLAIESFDITNAQTHTVHGEPYNFEPDRVAVENGRYVYNYIAPIELENTWNSVSKYPMWGKDAKGQQLFYTLIRYMTSKGLKKDKEGVLALSHLDIWAIENGIANERYLDSKNLNVMVYGYIWETYNYINGLNPQGNSLGQRFLFWRLGIDILKENLWWGVGTGDLQLAYDQKYMELPFAVDTKYQLRAHNQYLTMGIAFGIIGGIYFLLTLLSVFKEPHSVSSYLFLGFYVILLISMLDEDTLETQFGVTFALFFTFFLLRHQPRN